MSNFYQPQWADWVRDRWEGIHRWFYNRSDAFGYLGVIIGVVVLNLAFLAAGVWVVVWVLQSTGVL